MHEISNNVAFWHVKIRTSPCSLLVSLESPNGVQSVAKQSYNTQATSKGSDRTARMRRLIWGFAGRTYHIVGNLMYWLKCNMKLHFFRKSDYSIQFTKIFHWVILVNNKGFRFGITECNHPYKIPLKASNDILMFQIFTKAKDIFLSEWVMLVWSDGWPITWSSAPRNVHYWV